MSERRRTVTDRLVTVIATGFDGKMPSAAAAAVAGAAVEKGETKIESFKIRDFDIPSFMRK